jgi:hypothetical protein|tara:strand:- start:1252 stop:1386 length:135 start_codon:yes stop_codon:yes gene_type:complete
MEGSVLSEMRGAGFLRVFSVLLRASGERRTSKGYPVLGKNGMEV